MPFQRSRLMLTSCLLSSALVGGCQSADSNGVRQSFSWNSSNQTARVAAPINPVPPPNIVLLGSVAVPVGDGQIAGNQSTVQVQAQNEHVILPSPAMPLDVVLKPGETLVQAAPTEILSPEPLKNDGPAYPRGAPSTARKGYDDITAHGSFAHAPDYSWISGEAMKWRNEWRLRYASVDETDVHGGSLILANDSRFEQLHDGEHYKLQGRVENHGPKATDMVFYIESVELAGH